MGYSKKEEIAKVRKERREAKAAKKRNVDIREKLVRFLIVCEGSKTEPHYFESLIENCISTVREVKIEGEGMATVALVNKTLEIKNDLEHRNAMHFDRVWVVFDKDDFNDFDEAIKKADKLGFHSAWTNEAFELWYFLHFEYLDTGIGRADYIRKIEDAFRKRMNNPNFRYKKGDPDIYELLQQYGREDLAKKYAKELRKLYSNKNYSTYKPCTMVDKLVKELESPESLLKKQKN